MGLFNAKCTSLARLDGKVAVITGCNTGIGKVTAKDFFQRGARVIMACRNIEKANAAMEEIKKECVTEDKNTLGEIETIQLDLTSLTSIRKCASSLIEKETSIQLLVNNAGIMTCPYSKTEDGHEIQFGTNHLGHFLFTLLLLPKIVKSAPARIVNLSSVAHTRGTMNFDDLNWEKRAYNSVNAYGQSKLANVLFSKELSRRLREAGIKDVNVYALHPGVIKTELGRHLDDTFFKGLRFLFNTVFGWMLKSPLQGAQTSIYCSIDEKCENETGLYYAECKVASASAAANNEEDAKKLWIESMKLVGLEENHNVFGK